MSKYQSDAMRSFQRALDDAKFQSEIGLRISESYNKSALSALSPFKDTFRPLINQSNSLSLVFSDYKMPRLLTQKDIDRMIPKIDFESITQPLRSFSSQLQVTSSMLSNMTDSFTVFQELQNRNTLVNISTVVVDEDVEDEDKELWQGFVSFVIKSMPTAFHYTFGITQSLLTVAEILSDSTNFMLLMFIYTHFNSIDKKDNDED